MTQSCLNYSCRLTGAAPDSLKSEEDTFHKIEMDLVRGLRRVFRKGRGITIQQISQILSPRSSLSQPASIRKRIGPSSTLPRKRLVSYCTKQFGQFGGWYVPMRQLAFLDCAMRVVHS